MRGRSEAGYTLVEVLVVAAIVALMMGAIGAFFLGGATPAVASAARDVGAAFDEARQTALATDGATVAFGPALAGSGYSARIYAHAPGDAAFHVVNGPDYASTVTISEVASPLGAPGFAFSIDHLGAITGIKNFTPSGGGTSEPCPSTGAFTLRLADARDIRIINVPCALTQSATTPLVVETPGPAITNTPLPTWSCPPAKLCSTPPTLALITAPPCPNGDTPDSTPGICDTPAPTAPPPTAAPTAAATCPPGLSGTPPHCINTPATPPATPTPSVPHVLIESYNVTGCSGSFGGNDCYYAVGNTVFIYEDGTWDAGPPGSTYPCGTNGTIVSNFYYPELTGPMPSTHYTPTTDPAGASTEEAGDWGIANVQALHYDGGHVGYSDYYCPGYTL